MTSNTWKGRFIWIHSVRPSRTCCLTFVLKEYHFFENFLFTAVPPVPYNPTLCPLSFITTHQLQLVLAHTLPNTGQSTRAKPWKKTDPNHCLRIAPQVRAHEPLPNLRPLQWFCIFNGGTEELWNRCPICAWALHWHFSLLWQLCVSFFFFFFNKYHASILKSIRVKNIHINVEFTYLKTKEVYISLAEFSHYFPAY